MAYFCHGDSHGGYASVHDESGTNGPRVLIFAVYLLRIYYPHAVWELVLSRKLSYITGCGHSVNFMRFRIVPTKRKTNKIQSTMAVVRARLYALFGAFGRLSKDIR